MATKKNAKKVDLTIGPGTISFPHLFKETATKNDAGETVYDLQFIIPKSQKAEIRALMKAIKEVGEAQWGERWKKVRHPLRDGDAEADELTEDGSTKGEKYPERLGCYFLNARSKKPVGVVGRDRSPIIDPDEVYGGCKGKINITLYPYSNSGNHGIGVGLNGVQKIADGDSFGGGRPSVESMFDVLDDEDDLDDLVDDVDVDEDDDEDEAPAKPAKKKAARKAPAKKKAEPVDLDDEDEDEDDDLDEFDEDDDL